MVSAYFIMFRSYNFADAKNSTFSTFDVSRNDVSKNDDNCGSDNPIHDPLSSLLSMFIMSQRYNAFSAGKKAK
jgi:hypothetical protein